MTGTELSGLVILLLMRFICIAMAAKIMSEKMSRNLWKPWGHEFWGQEQKFWSRKIGFKWKLRIFWAKSFHLQVLGKSLIWLHSRTSKLPRAFLVFLQIFVDSWGLGLAFHDNKLGCPQGNQIHSGVLLFDVRLCEFGVLSEQISHKPQRSWWCFDTIFCVFSYSQIWQHMVEDDWRQVVSFLAYGDSSFCVTLMWNISDGPSVLSHCIRF